MKEIKENIKNKKFHRVYLLTGDQTYSILQAKRLLISAMVSLDDEMNYTTYAGDKIDISELSERLMTFPFFSDKRVVELNRTDILKCDPEKVISIMERIPETSCLVIISPDMDKRSKLYKWIKKNAYAAEFSISKGNDSNTLKAIGTFLKNSGKLIKESDARLIASRIGNDYFDIKNEIDKLVAYMGEREVVERSDIEAVIVSKAEDKIFEMVDAIATAEQKKVYDCYDQLLALKESPARTIVLLYRHYRRLLMIKSMVQQGMSDAEIIKNAGVRSFALKRYYLQIKKYKTKDIKDCMEQCLDMDCAFKSGNMTDQIACESLITELVMR